MDTLERLGADHLACAVVAYRDALRAHQDAINRMNVYPVPDGDTGTNMALTLESVVAELAMMEGADLEVVTQAITHGSLMGARGNSGVILSQILRGVADAFRADPDGGGVTVVDALARATAGAYGAVTRPVEGTILSVLRAASEAATGAASAADADLVVVLDAARAEAGAALERTPEQLPVLKQAGVVDAGGAGLVLLLDAFLHVADGRPLPVAPTGGADAPAPSALIHRADDRDPVGDLRYEVMYFLEAPDETIPAFRDVWKGVGDSIVVVGGGGLWNCHIHTDDIGAAIEAALDVGRPRDIRVTDLFDQVQEERWVLEAALEQGPPGPVEAVHCAVVAVATGDGIRRIFHSLGVQQIVGGGQSMNPSTADILDAIEAAPAPEVVVLPNNDNVVGVAEQAAALSSKQARVVPTSGVAEGFAALLEYDPEASLESNARAMAASAAGVVSGEVTQAVRAGTCRAGAVRRGDYLGLSRSGIEVVAQSITDAACDLLRTLVRDDHEIVTIIEGREATKAETRVITDWLAEHRPGVSREVHHGGQPLYPYLFSIE
jgi:DAK2 domain fusion protein YloV